MEGTSGSAYRSKCLGDPTGSRNGLFARGRHYSAPSVPHMDILAFGGLANLFAILLLVKELPDGTAARQVGIVFATCWITALGAGAVLISQHELASRGARTQNLYAIEETVRAYVATGDRKHLEGNPPPTIPY